MSSSKDFRGDIFDSLHDTKISACSRLGIFEEYKTYRFLLVALDNGEISRIMHTLHHEPRDGFLVLGVDTRSFNQLVLELGDGCLARVLGTKVNLFKT